jgi:hypothetical protein
MQEFPKHKDVDHRTPTGAWSAVYLETEFSVTRDLVMRAISENIAAAYQSFFPLFANFPL